MRQLYLLLLLVLVAGCAGEVELEPAAPLAVSTEQLEQLYKWGRGPHAVEAVSGLELPHKTRDEILEFNAVYPGGEITDLPVLLFAHGNFSDNTQYDALIDHWVSHGYVVLAPQHLDAKSGYLGATVNMVKFGNFGLIQARYDDLLTLLEQLEEIEKLVPALAGRLNLERIAATGHSFGGFTAQQFGGAAAQNMDNGEYQILRDPRITAVLAVSPPGPMFDEINEGSWQQLDKPALLTTGTWDVNAMFWPDWRVHKMGFDTASAEDQYALIVQGADHYLGNLICRLDLEEPPQHDALNMVNNLSVAFLDAYLKGDLVALNYLRSGSLDSITEGFAVLEHR